jgi:hypothetical protein
MGLGQTYPFIRFSTFSWSTCLPYFFVLLTVRACQQHRIVTPCMSLANVGAESVNLHDGCLPSSSWSIRQYFGYIMWRCEEAEQQMQDVQNKTFRFLRAPLEYVPSEVWRDTLTFHA